MSESLKLSPPEPHKTWLDYAVANMETRHLYLDHLASSHSPWPQETSRQQMQESARLELDSLRTALESAFDYAVTSDGSPEGNAYQLRTIAALIGKQLGRCLTCGHDLELHADDDSCPPN